MLRTIMVTVLVLAVVLGARAAAQPLSLSPDGRHLAAFRKIPTSKAHDKGQHLDIFNTACLLADKPREDCVEGPGIDEYTARGIQWASDSQSVLAGINRTMIRIDGQPVSKTRPSGMPSITPRTFQADKEEFLAQPSEAFSALGSLDYNLVVVDGGFRPVGYFANDYSLHNLTGQSLQLPVVVYTQMFGLSIPPNGQIIAPTYGDRFWLWSAAMGDNGLLTEFAPGEVKAIALPTHAGPAQLAIDTQSGTPAALYDPFGIYPLASTGRSLDWLVANFVNLRTRHSGIEITALSISTADQTAAMRVRASPSCSEDWLLRGPDAKPVGPGCAEWSYASSPVLIPASMPLRARLFRSLRDSGAHGGLIIHFHGGPTTESFRSPPPPETFVEGFDVLIVDYRGSTGEGAAYAEALKQPLGDIAAADLRSAIDWARSQPEYAKRLVGFWGDSWGGFAGHAVLSRDSGGLDFIVSDSAFIEARPESWVNMCKYPMDLSAMIFGVVPDLKGDCAARSSGVLGRKVTQKTPILLITGDKDNLVTPQATTLEWARQARRNGACVSVIRSAVGGHTLGAWPEATRAQVASELKTWIAAAANHQPAACETQLSLP